MSKLFEELEKFIKETRESNKEVPYLSEFENGCIEGSNNVVDDLEILIEKFK